MHDEDPQVDRRRAEAADPATTPERQFELSTQHPELLPVLATNPALYEDLRTWLASLGDPAIDEGLELAAARASAAAAPHAARRDRGGGVDAGVDAGARPRGTDTTPEGIPLDETVILPRVRAPGEPPVRTSLGVRRGAGGRGSTVAALGAVAPRDQGPPATGPTTTEPTTIEPTGTGPTATELTATEPTTLPAANDIEPADGVGGVGESEWTARDEAAWRRRRRAGRGLSVLALILAVVGLLWTTGTLSVAAPAPHPPALPTPAPQLPVHPPALAPPAEEATWPHTESPPPIPRAEAASIRTTRATSTAS